MPSTAVVADTTSYLTPELVDEYDIHLVSLYVGIEGEQDREADIADLHGFYERLRSSDQMVTTSQPSVGDFLSACGVEADEAERLCPFVRETVARFGRAVVRADAACVAISEPDRPR